MYTVRSIIIFRFRGIRNKRDTIRASERDRKRERNGVSSRDIIDKHAL